MNEERYGHVITAYTQEATDVILLDPVFVNPNSTDTIPLVLRHIGRKAGISKYSQGGAEGRQWTCVCCDGVAKFAILFVVTIIFIYIVLFNHPVLQITFVLLSPCSN